VSPADIQTKILLQGSKTLTRQKSSAPPAEQFCRPLTQTDHRSLTSYDRCVQQCYDFAGDGMILAVTCAASDYATKSILSALLLLDAHTHIYNL